MEVVILVYVLSLLLKRPKSFVLLTKIILSSQHFLLYYCCNFTFICFRNEISTNPGIRWGNRYTSMYFHARLQKSIATTKVQALWCPSPVKGLRTRFRNATRPFFIRCWHSTRLKRRHALCVAMSLWPTARTRSLFPPPSRHVSLWMQRFKAHCHINSEHLKHTCVDIAPNNLIALLLCSIWQVCASFTQFSHVY